MGGGGGGLRGKERERGGWQVKKKNTEGRRDGNTFRGGAKERALPTPFQPFHVQRLHIHIKHVTYANELLSLFKYSMQSRKKDISAACLFFLLFFFIFWDFISKWHVPTPPFPLALISYTNTGFEIKP